MTERKESMARWMSACPSWVRRTGRALAKSCWYASRRCGIILPVNFFLPHPLDNKIARQLTNRGKQNRLVAICDLSAFPLSYDIVYFLINANAYRRSIGMDYLDIVFIADDQDPVQDGIMPLNPTGQKNWREYLFNLGLEATRLIPAAGNVQLFTDRQAFTTFFYNTANGNPLFPKNFKPYSPSYSPNKDLPPLYGMRHLYPLGNSSEDLYTVTPPQLYLDLAKRWIDQLNAKGPILTITLREAPFHTERNSNMEEWQKLTDHYKDTDIQFVILRDFYTLYSPSPISGPNVVELPESTLSIAFRAAIYQLANLNLFVNNGPAVLCKLNHRTRYIIFKMTSGLPGATVESLDYQHGVSTGESLPHSSPYQRMVWKNDRFETMKDELDQMLKILP